MSIIKNESKFEKKLKKNIMPITITNNINPNNYSFVNRKNQIASLYLKMGQKMKSKKLKNTKSCSNLQYSDESSKNNDSNNSFQLTNFSMLKNLKTNNNIVSSGFNTIRVQNYEPKLSNKQNYIIHVNLNRNHTSSLSNFDLNNKINNEKKNKKFKNIISLNNSEFYNSIYCLSTRDKFYQQKEESIDLKKIKNNMKTKKFKFPFNERKKNKYISTSFCNLNISKNINKTLQKNEKNNINNNLSKNKLISRINKEKQYKHSRFNTMIIDEKEINEIFNENTIFKKKFISGKCKNHIKHNKSVMSLANNENKNILNFPQFDSKKNENPNYHIKNTLSINGNKICVNNKKNILCNKKNEINKSNKRFIKNNNNNLNKKNKNPIIERKVKINRKDLLQEIKNKIDIKKNKDNKIRTKKAEKKTNNEKIKEFSKIIVFDDYKNKKTLNNFHTKNYGKSIKINIIKENNNIKKDISENKIKLLSNDSKSNESLKIEKIKSKPKKIKNNSIINDSLEQKLSNIFINDNNMKDNNLIDFSNNLNSNCFPFSLINQKKINYKKPLIKITTNSNISFNKNIGDNESSNSKIFNNSGILSNNQNNFKNLIIRKKNNIGNNSFHINKRLICYSSRDINNKNKEIKNILFDNENLEKLPESYDEKFDDLYSVVRKINFGSVLIGAESFFTINSQKYVEFEYSFNNEYFKKFGKNNIEENKSKYLKKIINSCSTKTDFSSSNKNFYKNIYNNSPNEFEISELI